MHLPNRLAVSLLVAASLFFSAPRVLAQEDRAVFRTETRLVLLHATVVDKNGHLVTNLGRTAFKVFENGAEQELRIFRREDVPVSLALVVDNSGSMRDKRQKVEAAAVALVKASNPQDEVMIVNFNDEAYEDVQFTNDIKRMEEGLTRIDSRGGTAMRDAIAMTIDRVRERAKKDKKVLLVITDGNDNTSALSLEKLIQKAHESEVVHYAIGLLSEEERREAQRAKRALGTLTTATGGLVYYPKDLAEVEKIALQVAHEIRNQYILAYTPKVQALDGSFRQIKVAVNGPNRPVARTRTGYYATPEPAKRPVAARPPAAAAR
ncbi:MAG: VWA domain-containing protein [Bryobacterales bacterium]|nr:VWA domain-containing protein [Bryobacterales bacterium]